MGDDQKFSKEVQVQQQRSMDQVEKQDTGKAASAFDRARSDQTQQQPPERVDSQQVANTGPGMNGPNPPANAKNEMAAESHSKDKAKDAAAVEKSRAEQLKEGAMQQRQQQQREQSKGEKER